MTLRVVREQDVNTAYKLTCDICDAAETLFEQQQFNPSYIEIVWQDFMPEYEISLAVSIRAKARVFNSNEPSRKD